MRVPKRIEQLLAAVLSSPAEAELDVRRAVFEHTRDGRSKPRMAEFPGELGELVETLDQYPWKIGDREFHRLREAGYSEDQLFEITVAAAVGAGIRRWQAGLCAIDSAGEQRGDSHAETEIAVAAEDEKNGGRR